MGIRFYCPNGHKLNVKEKLAGKRGICPQCGIKLLIPPKSTRPSSREERSQQGMLAGGAGGNPNEFDVFMDDPEMEIAPDGRRPPEIQTQMIDATTMLSLAFDDPEVVWYVQFPDGQQYGPATLPIIRTWIKEHRISPTMLVWREGWQDWLEAGQVFPEVVQIFQKSKLNKSKNEQISEKQPPVDQRLDTGDDVQRTSVLMIVMIVLTVVVLGGILFYILKP